MNRTMRDPAAPDRLTLPVLVLRQALVLARLMRRHLAPHRWTLVLLVVVVDSASFNPAELDAM